MGGILGTRGRAWPALSLAIASLLAVAGQAHAVLPTDPQAAQSTPLTQIRVGEAYERLAHPLADVPVVVADTGLDRNHPEIKPRLSGTLGPDLIGDPIPRNLTNCQMQPPLYQEEPDADPSDPLGPCSGHGTLVAGVLGAAANNGIGSAGVAPNARFIPIRSCWDFDNCYSHIQGTAFRFAAQHGSRVVSLSWTQGINQDQLDAIAASPNTLFVTIPGGNDGAFDAEAPGVPGGLPYPCSANLPNIICVSTSSPTDGLDCGPYGKTIVDIATPTQGIIAPVNGTGGTLQGGCATSFASPMVAGVATILFGLVPQATPADVKAAILKGARPAAAWAGKSVTGGVLDAVGAVDALQAQYGLSPPPPLTGAAIAKGKGPPKKTTKKKAKFTWTSGIANAEFECKLDRKKKKDCTSPHKVKGLKLGRHKFKVEVSSGNAVVGSINWKWKVVRK